MDIDWNESPINSVNWYMKIPDIFIKEAGITARYITLGNLLRMCQRLRIANEHGSAKLKSELDQSTRFKKELIMFEAKHRSAAKESEETAFCGQAAGS